MRSIHIPWKRALLTALLVCSLFAGLEAAESRTARRFFRYFQAAGRADASVSLVERVIYSLFYAETEECTGRMPRATRPT